MDKASKDELLSKVKFLEAKLRDVVTAYKSLQKEKQALENGLKAIKNVSDVDSSSDSSKNEKEKESTSSSGDEKLSSEVTTLMNSLTSLSAEKSRMEASFQADKKKLRQENDRLEMAIRELQDKIKSINLEHSKEIEQLKTHLIIERHEREKEQNEYQTKLRELETFLKQEQESKMFLEQAFSEITLREESERTKQVDQSEKILNIQRAHMSALEKEKQKFQQEAQRAYEQRIASLESKLAELSSTLAKYNRSRQEDQHEILQLRGKISELSCLTAVSNVCASKDVSCQTYNEPFDVEKKNVEMLIDYEDTASAKLFYDKQTNSSEYLSTLATTLASSNGKHTNKEKDSHTNILENELKNLEIKLQMLTDQNNILSEQYNETVLRYEKQIDELRKHQVLLLSRCENDIQDLHKSYRFQISELESQVQKQRERTLALLEEKEQEVTTLKTSFQLFVPGNKHAVVPEMSPETHSVSQLTEVLNDAPKVINAQENPHILYYAHELARRDVLITSLRKNCSQLENSLREIKKEIIILKQSNQEKVNVLKNQISRLERCQSREGANLEYLKNVIVNYLQTNNASSKRHMLNAIAVILKLTDSEISKIKNAL